MITKLNLKRHKFNEIEFLIFKFKKDTDENTESFFVYFVWPASCVELRGINACGGFCGMFLPRIK